MFCRRSFGNVYIHRIDRFKYGWIEPNSDEYYSIRAELIQDLLSLYNGKRVVDEVFIAEETYNGPLSGKLLI